MTTLNKLHSTLISEKFMYQILCVTTAMTSSWAAADSRKVTNVARDREHWYDVIIDVST